MMRRILLGIAMAGVVTACATAPATRSAAPDPAKAVPIAERPAKQDALAAGRAAFHSGDLARAEELLRSAAQAAPGDVAPLLALADVHVAQRRFPDAVADLDRAAALGENAAVLAARGRALGLVRRFDDASRDLERAAELEASRSETWATLAAVQVNRGDQVEADRAFAALVQLGDPAAAQDRAWTQLLAMLPDQVAPQETLDRCSRGVVAGLAGEWIEAERELRSGLRYAPGHAWCGAQWAESLARTGELARAEQSFRMAISAFPADQAPLRGDAEGRLAALLVSTRRNAAEAVSLARSALAARGDRAALLFVLGRACELARDAACSADAYRRLVALPHVPEAMRANATERLGPAPSSASR